MTPSAPGSSPPSPSLMLRKKPPTLFLADPDLPFLETVWRDPEAQLVPPVFVQTLKEAQLALSQHKEGLSGIFINPNVSKQGGLDAIRFAHHYHPAVPIFLICDTEADLDEEVFSEENLRELGIQKVLFKPISYGELLKLVTPPGDLFDPQDALEIAQRNKDALGEEVTSGDITFFPVRAESFLSGSKVFFDVYVRLASSRFVMILRAGDTFSLDRIKTYLKKGTTHFYLRREAQEHYVNFCDKLVLAIIKSPKIHSSVKISQIFHHGQETINLLKAQGIEKSSIDYAMGFVGNVEQLVKQLDLKQYDVFGQFMKNMTSYDHGVSTAIMTSLVARHLGIEHERAIHTCGLASLFHDVGLFKLPEKFRKEEPPSFKGEELRLYQTHPMTGSEMLQYVPGLDPVICQIVEQHHERKNREGYPKQIGGSSVLQFAEVVGICDEFLIFAYRAKEDLSQNPFTEMIGAYEGFSSAVVNAFQSAFYPH